MKNDLSRRLLEYFALVSLATVFCGSLGAQTSWKIGTVQAAAGGTQSGYLDVPKGADGETRIPITLINGVRPGPTLALIAGNHGYEYPPILASERVRSKIDPRNLHGRVVIVHVANMPSFLKRTIYYSPIDGLNLNRVYPGKIDGTISYRIAYVITREVIERADYLIDLHCGDGNESLRPYSYWMPIGEEKVDELSRQLTLAFGMENIVIDRMRPKDAGASQYCSNTAVTRGKPATTIESGGMGIAYDEESIARIEKGIMNVMRHLRMIDGKAEMPAHPRWYEPAEVLRFPENLADKAGLFYAVAQKGQMVANDALLGYVTDFFGKRIFELRAPFAGEVLYIIGTPPTSAGEPLAFVGAIKN
jgi:predicted deacylase